VLTQDINAAVRSFVFWMRCAYLHRACLF